VYLDRPWFQTGEGELLGVLLQGPQSLPDGLRSRYGLDAIWAGGPDPGAAVALAPHHFRDPAAVADVRLPEEGGLQAVVAGFAPVWDAARKLFACDIALDLDTLPWSYWPFVRLAFVRFQPESLDDAMVSKAVLGEFGQVAPGRTLSLAWQGDGRVAVSLRGRAPAEPFPTRLALRVQRTAVPAGSEPDELDWEHVAGDPVAIDAPAFFHLVEPTDPDADGNLLWEHAVDLPVARHAARMRLEVAEYELLHADREFGRGLPRITYAAHVPLA
jgi:hypothetical protein